jgi:hypothetical protein
MNHSPAVTAGLHRRAFPLAALDGLEPPKR